ncbi:MAG TPA: saccharopine dehydrogenase C-terminal domain-containing protein [Bacteroidales bacterium]|nr:saccharopine dehydrogenase C-terminal domain-containing protein [Bacteroidales bacterium]
MKKVLILGAGLVVRPMVSFLLENNYRVTVASRTKSKADDLIKGHNNGISVSWTTDDHDTLEKLVDENDIVVSLLPYRYHVEVARICIRYAKPVVTTSYVQREMLDLDRSAKESGILILNEIGLDPGIDHMSAMRIIHHVHGKGGKIDEFYSLCGALPAPEDADNPLGYKFSWSPKGVVLASRNSALYLKNGKKVTIEPADLFKNRFSYSFPQIGELEVYPNRDSISYIDIYGIHETKTMYRGTFRHKGWCETLDAMKTLNMLDDNVKDYSGMSYSDFMAERGSIENADVKTGIAAYLNMTSDSVAMKALEFLGFFSKEKLPYGQTSPFEITSDRMINKISLGKNERDMVVLQHVFLASYPDGKKEVIKSSMLDFGSPASDTAVARTVSLPAAIAVKMILEGKIRVTGVYRPVIPEIYDPVLDELKKLGIEMKEEYGLSEREMI